MKTVAILFLVAVIATQAQGNFLFDAFSALFTQADGELSLIQRAVTAAARTRCRWTENMTQEEEDEIRAKKFDNLSRTQQCFIKCVTDTFRFADVAVDLLAIDQTSFNKILDPLVKEDEAAVISAECDKLKGADECETSAIKYKCYADLNATSLI